MEPLSQTKPPLAAALKSIRGRIEHACLRAGRDSGSVTLLAASKAQPVEMIRAAVSCGQVLFGENYAQELAAKAQQLGDLEVVWHFIGRIQSNKIRLIAQFAHCVQTLDNLRHAKLLHKELVQLNKLPFPVFIEVNCGDESQKSGVAVSEVEELAQSIARECPGLDILGIMAIPPAKLSELAASGNVPTTYQDLRKIADRIGQRMLSLGMSADLDSAIAAGSNLVRVGTAIFGARQ
jgi:pyridoxal phosphate enzyme (YggS family)